MSGKSWMLIGFAESFIFPVFVLWIVASGIMLGPSALAITVGVIYPLGLLALVLFGLLLSRFRPGFPQSYIAFCNGARYAMLGVAALSLPLLAIATFLVHQSATVDGLMAVAVGGICLPFGAEAGAYASAVGKSVNLDSFLSRARKGPYTFERIVLVFLSIFLGKIEAIRKFPESLVYVLALGLLYVFGWVVLGTAGIFPASLFGLSFVLVAPLLGFLLLRGDTSHEDRDLLRTVLENYRR